MQNETPEAGDLRSYLEELTELSLRRGFGLTKGAEIFILEPEDQGREYRADEHSQLTFV